jgi:hypothetical protein
MTKKTLKSKPYVVLILSRTVYSRLIIEKFPEMAVAAIILSVNMVFIILRPSKIYTNTYTHVYPFVIWH